jgi:hypothetical protein
MNLDHPARFEKVQSIDDGGCADAESHRERRVGRTWQVILSGLPNDREYPRGALYGMFALCR